MRLDAIDDGGGATRGVGGALSCRKVDDGNGASQSCMPMADRDPLKSLGF